MDGDDCDVWIGISSLKGEVYFQAILVVRCHRRNTFAEISEEQTIRGFRHMVTNIFTVSHESKERTRK